MFPMMFRTFRHIIFAWSFSNFSCAFVHFPQFSYNFHSFPMCLPIYIPDPFHTYSAYFPSFPMYFPWFLPYFPIFPIYFPYILHIFPMFFTRFPRVVLAPVTARPLSRRGILRQRRQSFLALRGAHRWRRRPKAEWMWFGVSINRVCWGVLTISNVGIWLINDGWLMIIDDEWFD